MSNFYDIIKEKGNNFEDVVPPDAWDNIMKKKKKRRFGFFWPVLLLFCGASIIAVNHYRKNDNNKKLTEIGSFVKQEAGVDHAENTETKFQPVAENNSTNTKTPAVNDIIVASKASQKNRTLDKESNRGVQKKDIDKNSGPAAILETVTGKGKTVFFKTSTTKNSNLSGGQKAVEILGHKKNNGRKDKGRSQMNIRNVEPDDESNSAIVQAGQAPLVVEKDNDDVLVVTEPAQIKEIDKTQNEEVKKSLADNKIPVDSPAQKPLQTKNMEKSKKPPVIPAQHKKNLFLEFALTPSVAIQQNTQDVVFNRTLLKKDGRSIFSGNMQRSVIKAAPAFSLALKKPLNKKTSLSIGLQYQQLNEQVRISGTQIFTQFNVDNDHLYYNEGGQYIGDTSFIILTNQRNFNAVNRYIFLSVPLSFQYNFWQKKRWSLGIDAGLTVRIISSYRNHINYNSEAPLINNSQDMAGNTNIGFSLSTGLRASRYINKNFLVFVTPTFSYSPATQHIKNSLVDRKIHQAGISFGVSYKIK